MILRFHKTFSFWHCKLRMLCSFISLKVFHWKNHMTFFLNFQTEHRKRFTLFSSLLKGIYSIFKNYMKESSYCKSWLHSKKYHQPSTGLWLSWLVWSNHMMGFWCFVPFWIQLWRRETNQSTQLLKETPLEHVAN